MTNPNTQPLSEETAAPAPVKPSKAQLLDIAKDSAYLLAAMSDLTIDPNAKSREIADTVADLGPKLEAVGLLGDYRRADGSLGLW